MQTSLERDPLGAPAVEQHTLHNDSFNKTNGISTEPQHHHSTSLPAAVNGGTPVTSEFSGSSLTKKKRRFGIFPVAMGLLVVGGVLAASFLGKDSEQNPSATPNLSGVSTAAKMKSQSASIVPAHKEARSVDKSVRGAPAIAQASPVESKTGGEPQNQPRLRALPHPARFLRWFGRATKSFNQPVSLALPASTPNSSPMLNPGRRST